MRILAVFLLFLLISIALQAAAGAWSSEIWDYDEAAHYVTGMMVHDFLRSPLQSPISFARTYYDHYPKVALGHWPPAFYAVQGVWTSIFSRSIESVLALLAALAAGIGTLVWWQWRRDLGDAIAIGAAAIFLLLPITQNSLFYLMAELPLVLSVLAAGWAFCWFIETRTLRAALAFGALSTVAILTKPNGWLLAFVPPIALLLTRNLKLLRLPTIWIAAALVLAISVPWYVLTFRMVEEGWSGGTQPQFLGSVALTNLRFVIRDAGWIAIILAIPGFWDRVARRVLSSRVSPLWAVLSALAISCYLFHSFAVPVREARHLLLVDLAILLFAAAGATVVAQWCARWPVVRTPVFWAATAAVLILTTQFRLRSKPAYGSRQVVDAVLAMTPSQSSPILVTSVVSGEGAVISEIARREDGQRLRRVLRASKSIATMRWDGKAYRFPYEDPASLLRRIDELGVKLLVIDHHRHPLLAHHRSIRAVVEKFPERFRPVPLAGQVAFDLFELLEAGK